MVGRVPRTVGSVLAITLGLAIPVLATSSSSPAGAATVVDGCIIVSSPTPTDYTSCPGADLAGADLASFDLAYANLEGAQFVTCAYVVFPAATCTEASLTSANLTDANLSNTTLSLTEIFEDSVASGAADLSAATLVGANLSQASAYLNDLTGADGNGVNLTDANLGGANLTNADLADANLNGAILSGPEPPAGSLSATLTGANFTGTVLIPSNQTVTQMSSKGSVVTWSTPPAIPGATPGSCSPPPGSTFSPGPSTVTCEVLDSTNDVASGTFQVDVVPANTRVLIPSPGANLSGGSSLLDASTSPDASSVTYELSGGTLNDKLIATGTLTNYGWLAEWNTTTVPNGTYSLQSVASYAGGVSATSASVSITVVNPPPTSTVLIPSAGASLSGGSSLLDASTSPDVSSVTYELSGGTLSDKVIATGTPTYYGWLAEWNTATVPNGTYSLQSVAAYQNGVSETSQGISVTVANVSLQTELILPTNGSTQSGTIVFDALAQGSNVTGVYFDVSFGPLIEYEFLTATLTYFGWIGEWNSSACPPGYPNGTYVFQSVVTQAGGATAMSAPVDVVLSNSGGCP